RKHVRKYALGELRNVGPEAAEAIPALIKALREVGDLATVPLVGIGPVAIPALLEAAKDSDERARLLALDTLGSSGSAAQSAVPPLRGMLKDPSPAVRVRAAGALWQVTGKADDAIPVLIGIFEDQKDNASLRRYRADHWLAQIGQPAVLAL